MGIPFSQTPLKRGPFGAAARTTTCRSEAGTFRYVCTLHPTRMKGTVVVCR